jgi:hypothetical protein
MVMLHVPVTGTGTEHIVKVIFSLANTMFTNLLSSDDITFNDQALPFISTLHVPLFSHGLLSHGETII